MGGQDSLLGNIFNIIISEKPWVMVAGRLLLMDWSSRKFGFTIVCMGTYGHLINSYEL